MTFELVVVTVVVLGRIVEKVKGPYAGLMGG